MTISEQAIYEVVIAELRGLRGDIQALTKLLDQRLPPALPVWALGVPDTAANDPPNVLRPVWPAPTGVIR